MTEEQHKALSTLPTVSSYNRDKNPSEEDKKQQKIQTPIEHMHNEMRALKLKLKEKGYHPFILYVIGILPRKVPISIVTMIAEDLGFVKTFKYVDRTSQCVELKRDLEGTKFRIEYFQDIGRDDAVTNEELVNLYQRKESLKMKLKEAKLESKQYFDQKKQHDCGESEIAQSMMKVLLSAYNNPCINFGPGSPYRNMIIERVHSIARTEIPLIKLLWRLNAIRHMDPRHLKQLFFKNGVLDPILFDCMMDLSVRLRNSFNNSLSNFKSPGDFVVELVRMLKGFLDNQNTKPKTTPTLYERVIANMNTYPMTDERSGWKPHIRPEDVRSGEPTYFREEVEDLMLRRGYYEKRYKKTIIAECKDYLHKYTFQQDYPDVNSRTVVLTFLQTIVWFYGFVTGNLDHRVIRDIVVKTFGDFSQEIGGVCPVIQPRIIVSSLSVDFSLNPDSLEEATQKARESHLVAKEKIKREQEEVKKLKIAQERDDMKKKKAVQAAMSAKTPKKK